MKNFELITVDPAQMGGVPCVRHLRIPVATVLRLLAGGMGESEILSGYPDLELEDIRACLRFAAHPTPEALVGVWSELRSDLEFLHFSAIFHPSTHDTWGRRFRLPTRYVLPQKASPLASR